MSGYLQIFKIAMLTFPFIAFMISAPFILIEYHKYGSISFFKALIIYSFSLYFLCAYFLIILPLPKISEVALLTTPQVQLIPFKFIVDFVSHSSFNILNIHTYLLAIKESYFFVPIYNILLTLPFGVYLSYYFKCDKKKTILYTFLLSLFFEITQFSGLYYLYPRGYRLFDIDDLMLNTLGGLLGYFVAIPLIKILPKQEKVELKAKQRGKVISGFRRTTSFILDLFIVGFVALFIHLFIKNNYVFLICFIIYYLIIPMFLNCSTLGQKFLNIRVVDMNDKPNILRLLLRNILFVLIYILAPYLVTYGLSHLESNGVIELLGIIYLGIMFIFYIVTAFKYLCTKKSLVYEKLSKTKLQSTIK